MVLVWWPIYARLLRAQVVSCGSGRTSRRPWRRASAGGGCSAIAHPAARRSRPVLVNATMDFGQVVLLVASLSFIGLGADPPSPEWGLMITEGDRQLLPVVDRARAGRGDPHGRAGVQLHRRRPARPVRRPHGGDLVVSSAMRPRPARARPPAPARDQRSRRDDRAGQNALTAVRGIDLDARPRRERSASSASRARARA